MKFAHKLTLAIVLPLCVALSAGGTWSIHQNFRAALDAAARTYGADQMEQRYALELCRGTAPTKSIPVSALTSKNSALWAGRNCCLL